MGLKVIQVGESRIWFEPPDIVREELVGALSVEDVRKIVAASGSFVVDSHYYVIADVARLRTISPEGRKLGVEMGALPNRRGIAILGASVHIRVLGSLVSRAMVLVQKGAATPVRFFETEQQARAWIDEIRPASAARTSGS